MLWVLLTLISAFASAIADALCKKAGEIEGFWTVTWARFGYAIPFLVPLLLVIDIPLLDRTFWMTTGAPIPLEITAALLYNKAIQISPLSLTVPLLSFTSLFLLLIPGLTLGEKLSTRGVAGVILVTLGAYLLHIHLGKKDIVEPLRAILRERGSRLMLFAAAIYSITISVKRSSMIFTTLFGWLFFEETNLGERLLGSAVMLTGVVLISLG